MQNDSASNPDMPKEEFRKFGYRMVDWIADYIENIENYPVLAQISPGDVKNKFDAAPPRTGKPFEDLFMEIEEKIMSGMTHWNHPGFMAYFNSTSSGPGILAEFLSAAFNVNGMLWKSSPASTELEEVTLNWFRQMVGLPEQFWGIIYDGASASTLHAIVAARENAEGFDTRNKGLGGYPGSPEFKIYASEFAHSSVEKAALILGFGIESVEKIGMDDEFKMKPDELWKKIKRDKENGKVPICVVATIGTTSVTSIDPVDEIAEICRKENIWLHVDGAHGGNSAILPEKRYLMNGWEKADSIVINPQKWMFMPIDISVFFTRKPEYLRKGFSLVAEYLKTDKDNVVKNQMDYGAQLGRRFRSLKLWFVIHYFGVEGLQNIIRNHFEIAENFRSYIEKSENFELLAPVPFSTVCFRANPGNVEKDKLDELNLNLMNAVNDSGQIFISHTITNGKFTLRLVVSGLRTRLKHILDAEKLFEEKLGNLLNENG